MRQAHLGSAIQLSVSSVYAVLHVSCHSCVVTEASAIVQAMCSTLQSPQCILWCQTEGTYVVLPLRLMQRNVLPDQDTDANAAQVKAIQKLMYLWHFKQANALLELLLELSNAHSHYRNDMPMPVVYMFQELCKLLLIIVISNCRELSKVFEGLHIPVSDLQTKSCV